MKQALAIDIGGTSVKYGWVDSQGRIEKEGKFLTGETRNLEEFICELESIIIEAVENNIVEIGISSLGVFDAKGQCLGGVENLEFLQGICIPDVLNQFLRAHCLSELTNEITITIMNDGVAAAMGEYWIGEAKACSNFVCVTLGTGIGGAIVLDGEPLLGKHFHSGEIGYTNYHSEEDYMELKYSTQNVIARAEKDDGYSFIEAIRNEEEKTVEIFVQWMEELGQFIANTILLIDPEKVIIGGGISVQKEILLPALREAVDKHLPEDFRGEVEICVARNGNQAGLLGAVGQYFK